MKPLFLFKQAEAGFDALCSDLEKLRQKNRGMIPEKNLRILDRVIGLLPVIGTVILAVAVIYAVWFVLNSYGMEAITKMTQWTIDILKFARIRI